MAAGRFLIYGLVDPRSGALFYIGKSTQGLKRARSHCYPGYLKRDRTRTGTRIKGLLARGLRPSIEVVELHDTSDPLADAERFWIANIRATGAELLNHCDGGEGAVGRCVSAETRAKIAAANKGKKSALGAIRSTETRAKLSEAAKRRQYSEEEKNHLRTLTVGRKLTKEHIAKIIAANTGQKRGPVSEETLARMRAAASIGAAKRRKSVVIVATGAVSPSVDDAAAVLGTCKSNLSMRLNGKKPWRDGRVLARFYQSESV